MRLRKYIFMLLMYLLPAFTVLAGYSLYHETLFKKPSCLSNCGNFEPQPNKKRSIQNTLDLIDQLAKYKAELMGNIGDLSNLDLSFLQSRLAQFSNQYDVVSRYGSGFLHHSWARLNTELNAKINDYLSNQYVNYFLAQAISPLANPYLGAKNPTGSRENLARSLLPNSNDLIPMALARDILPPGSNYFVSPSNLNGGAGGSSNPNNPGIPVSTVPLPSAVYFMLSGLLLLVGLRHKNRLLTQSLAI
jgi:hypothetical protein